MATTPEIIIKIPAILFTHRNPTRSSFFLKSLTTELRVRNHKQEPIKTPITRVEPEITLTSFANPRAENTPIKTKIVKGLVSVRITAEI